MLDLVDVQKRASRMAGPVMRRYNLPQSKFSPEDVVSEFLIKFVEKGFDKRYDETKSSLDRYVYLGVRNIAIYMARKVKHELQSVDALEEEGVLFPDERNVPSIIQKLYVDEVLEAAEKIKLARGEAVVYKGRVYNCNGKSVLQLYYEGYNRSEIAKIFGVSVPAICNIFKRVRKAYV